MSERWEPDPWVEPARAERATFDIEHYHVQLQVSEIVMADPRGLERTAREACYRLEGYAGKRLLHSARIEWPDGWREAVKEAAYPRIRRVLQVLMPMRGTRLADRIERRWPVRYQRRQMRAVEWLHRRFLERDSSRVAIEVLKPVPTRLDVSR